MNKCIKETPRLSETFHLLSGSIGTDNITPFTDPPTHDVRQMSLVLVLNRHTLLSLLLHLDRNHLYL